MQIGNRRDPAICEFAAPARRQCIPEQNRETPSSPIQDGVGTVARAICTAEIVNGAGVRERYNYN